MLYFNMAIVPSDKAQAKRERKRAYYQAYQKKHRVRLSAYWRKRREEQRQYLRIRWWFRRRFNRIMDPAGHHLQERKYQLMKKYKLSPEEYAKMLEDQGGVCAICRSPERRAKRDRYLCVDHDHSTNVIRSLLCHDCNTALGVAHDDVGRLQQMIDYLRRFNSGSASIGERQTPEGVRRLTNPD